MERGEAHDCSGADQPDRHGQRGHPVRGQRRGRHDLAQSPRGQELRQLGPADRPGRGARARRRGRGRSRGPDPRAREHVLRGRRPEHARQRVPGHDEQLGEDRPGLRPHVRSRVQSRQADHRRRRGLRRGRRLRAHDLLRLLHRGRRRAYRRLPHPPRAVRRRRARSTACRATSGCARPRSSCSPASCCPARSARTGAWPTSPRRRTSSTRRSRTSSHR